MKSRDYLLCALHLLLDDEEAAKNLCPLCRERAMEEGCPVCGGLVASWQEGENPGFDRERFERMKRGEHP